MGKNTSIYDFEISANVYHSIWNLSEYFNLISAILGNTYLSVYVFCIPKKNYIAPIYFNFYTSSMDGYMSKAGNIIRSSLAVNIIQRRICMGRNSIYTTKVDATTATPTTTKEAVDKGTANSKTKNITIYRP